jgi:hypothetical protein
VFLINPLFPQEKTMNEINTTAIEATTVAAQTTANTVTTLASSKTGRIAMGVAIVAVGAYGLYKAGGIALNKFKAHKSAKAAAAE